MPSIILKRTPRGGCRICGTTFFDSDSDVVIGRHMARCGQAHYEKTHPDREGLVFLKSWDPEYADWLKTAYRQGRVKPSTERL